MKRKCQQCLCLHKSLVSLVLHHLTFHLYFNLNLSMITLRFSMTSYC
uniref:Uncharacterized protein n=1 Tax=Amphimedon queenslandica TaxID=400682 RepID=A0A1X7T5S4_AMPQE